MTGGYYTAIEIVKNYGEYLEDIFYSLSMEYSLAERSYSRWAISELLERLECCLPGDEMSAMEKLGDKFLEYSRLNPNNSQIFLVAYDVVSNAIDLYFES